MPQKSEQKSKQKELSSPPAHEVVWVIWKRSDPTKRVKRTARTWFAARASACIELKADPMSLDGEIYDDSPPEKTKAEKKTKADTKPGKKSAPKKSKKAKKKSKAATKRKARPRSSARQSTS